MEFTIFVEKSLVLPAEAIDLWIAMGWGKSSDYSEDGVALALKNTTFAVFARDENSKVVGLARVLSDGEIHTCVTDIAVHPDFQNKGIGVRMMEKIKEKYGRTGIFLDAFAENDEFFAFCGYKKRDNMMVFSQKFEK